MKTHVRALVVGGGAVGTGIAYHLAKAGWDTMLIERDELTSGSTWHAAGLLPLFNMGYATTHIHKYSVDFYKALEAETGLNPGFYVVGNLRMAQTDARMDEYRLYSSVAETAGVHHEFLTPKEIKDRWPLVRTEDLLGALFHPHRRLHQPRRRDASHGQGRPPVRRDDRAPLAGRRLRMDRRGMDRQPDQDGRKGRQPRRLATRKPRSAPNMSSPPPATTPSAPPAFSASRSPRSRSSTSISSPNPTPRSSITARSQPRTPGPARRRRQMVRPRGARRLDPRPLREGRPCALRSTTCPRPSAPTSSRSISNGSRANTCPSSTASPRRKRRA